MNKNRWINLFILMICNAWTILVPFYGTIGDKMVLRSGNDLNIAQSIFICVFLLLTVIFSFIMNHYNIKNMMAAGLTGSAILSVLMWFWPVCQKYYFIYAIFGIFVALFTTAFCFMFIYGFTHELRVKATALFLFGAWLIPVIFTNVLMKLQSDLGFILSTLMLVLAIWLNHLFNPDEMISPTSIPVQPFPLKLILTVGSIIFLIYFNSGLIMNVIFRASLIDVKIQVLEAFLPLAVYLLIYFISRKTNLFFIMYGSLISMGVALIVYIAVRGNIPIVMFFSDISSILFNVFAFAFAGEVSLKYGRNFNVLRAMVLAVSLGAIAGELAGKSLMTGFNSSTVLAFGIPLFVLFISFLIIPWLAKYIKEEMKDPVECIEEENLQADNHLEVPFNNGNGMSSYSDRLIFANSLLDEGRQLTPRELEIASLLLERYDSDTIAKRLFISQNTLKVHIRHIYQKFQVSRKKEFIERVNPSSKPINSNKF